MRASRTMATGNADVPGHPSRRPRQEARPPQDEVPFLTSPPERPADLLPCIHAALDVAGCGEAGFLGKLHRHGGALAEGAVEDDAPPGGTRKLAQEAGLATACHIQGGMDAWKKIGGPLGR